MSARTEFEQVVDDLVLTTTDAETIEGFKVIDAEARRLCVSFYEVAWRCFVNEKARRWLQRYESEF